MIFPLRPQVSISLLLIITLSTGCPAPCICKWRNGKQTVECNGKGLLIIPDGIDTSTQVLDLSGSNFQYIQRETFLKMGLINLQKLFFNRCGVKTIEDDAFKGLTNLVELDLSANILETVPTEALLNCPSLMRLSLSKNPITSLDRLAFNHLSFLTTLDLSECEIAEVSEAAFSSLYSLEWIDLSRNKLKYFPNMRFFPKSLKGLQLQENPWTCDCHMRTFNSWLKRDIVPILIPPLCEEPRKYRGILVRSVNESQLACLPEVNPTTAYFEMEEGKNVTLLCQVKSIPSSKVSWIFRGQVLHNNTEPIPGFHLLYYIEEGQDEKESSLFIYNLNVENNGTFYCVAENSAGVATANYTVMIILKQAPVKLEEHTDFSFEIIPFLLAAGLVSVALCFVALIMALLKNCSKRKRQNEENRMKEVIPSPEKLPLKIKPILKSENRNNFFPNTSIEESVEVTGPIPKQNPDIINGIKNSNRSSPSGILLYSEKLLQENEHNLEFLPDPVPHKDKLPPVIVNSGATINPKSVFGPRNEQYLKPTLTSNFRPVSAPTFERYVENIDLRHTVDGYPASHRTVLTNCNLGRQLSYSEHSSPIRRMYRPVDLPGQITEVPGQTNMNKNNIQIYNDDVQL